MLSPAGLESFKENLAANENNIETYINKINQKRS